MEKPAIEKDEIFVPGDVPQSAQQGEQEG